MRNELATLVHPILAHGLRLRDRLARGESPSLEVEQSALVGLLGDERDARRIVDFGGTEPVRNTASEALPIEPFLGVRYALTCWLDELFVLDSPWAGVWNEAKLEVQLYGSNDRAWKFWDQARLASDRPSADALEAFYLCVMLGFTGERIDDPYALVEWIASTRRKLGQARARQWPTPPAREPATRVPLLSGRKSLRTMLVVGAVAVLALVPAVAVVLARRMS